MNNKDYLKSFVSKHHFNGKVDVQMKNGTTWDDVVSVIFNVSDIPSKTQIPITDIQFDVISDLPTDAFSQWLIYCENNGYIEYRIWLGEKNGYKPKTILNSEIDTLKYEIDESINNLFADFTNRYGNNFDANDYVEIDDSDYEEEKEKES